MQETNNFTNLTRLSSFLLIDMTWNTHLSAKNTERKRNILGDRETREESIGKRRRSWTMHDLTGFRLLRRVAHGRSLSLACREFEHHHRRLRKRNMGAPLHLHFSNDTLRFQEDHLFSRTGQAFFSFASFLSFFAFFFFFFFFFWNATAYFAQFAIHGYAPEFGENQPFTKKQKKILLSVLSNQWSSKLLICKGRVNDRFAYPLALHWSSRSLAFLFECCSQLQLAVKER